MVSEPVFWNPNPFWLPFIQTIIHSGQVSLAISQSDHLSLWPSLIPAISPCSQSQGRKPNSFQFPHVINSGNDFPDGRIVVRKHSPPANFPANFSGDVFFPHCGAPGGDLQFFPNHRSQKTTHALLAVWVKLIFQDWLRHLNARLLAGLYYIWVFLWAGTPGQVVFGILWLREFQED